MLKEKGGGSEKIKHGIFNIAPSMYIIMYLVCTLVSIYR